MKNILLIITMTTLIAPTMSYAEHVGHAEHKHTYEHEVTPPRPNTIEHSAGGYKIVVDVNGLVCDFCARALEKVFAKREGVAGIDVDLDNGKVTIVVKEGQIIEDTELTKLITHSGYNVVAIHRGVRHAE